MSDTISRPPSTIDTSLLLPDPEPRPVHHTIISVDDHLVEPPGMFEGRLASAHQERAPRVIEDEDGRQVWEFDGDRFMQVGLNAVAGRRPETYSMEPFRFDQMRKGCWDVDARIADMDLNGVWASLNFPSMITGFSARVFSMASDPELGLAVTKAWNDWLYEEWYLPYPERIIPSGITFLTDPEAGAAEIRRNAERGFTSVTLPERPHRIGLPSVFSGYWDPIIQACVDTDTVLSIHVGSSGGHDHAEGSPKLQVGGTLFPALSLTACVEWLWSGYPARHPDLKIVMSEGGIGWAAMLMDRLDNIVDRARYETGWDTDERPADVLQRNFWFCSIDDPSTVSTVDRVGTENIMLETDYPHSDGTWPDTQDLVQRNWGHLPVEDRRRISHGNAAEVYRHPLPEEPRP